MLFTRSRFLAYSTNPQSPVPPSQPISSPNAPPVISGMARRWAIRTITIGIGIGILFAEAYHRLYVLPRQRKVEKYYKERGVEFDRII